MPVDFEFVGNIVLIRTMGRPPLAFTHSQFDEARKHGEKYAQATPFDTRTTSTPYAENHQAPQEIDHASLALGGREIFSNRKQVTTLAKEGDVTPLVIEVPHVQLVIDLPTAHLLVDVIAGEISPTGDISPAGYTPSDTGGCTDVTPAA